MTLSNARIFKMLRSILAFFYLSFLSFPLVNAASSSISEVYLGSREGDPSSLVHNVSTIHGDYSEVEVDLVVSAPDAQLNCFLTI